MNILLNKLNDNKIPDRLQDKTTVYYNKTKKFHPLKNYLGCIILRIILGILIFYNLLKNTLMWIKYYVQVYKNLICCMINWKKLGV